jgi:hypothetical protein
MSLNVQREDITSLVAHTSKTPDLKSTFAYMYLSKDFINVLLANLISYNLNSLHVNFLLVSLKEVAVLSICRSE